MMQIRPSDILVRRGEVTGSSPVAPAINQKIDLTAKASAQNHSLCRASIGQIRCSCLVLFGPNLPHGAKNPN
jgi:hypothetical protein